jgi:hypothetical protein
MAIAATSVWEMRTTGSNTNGGFYKSDAGTTDYSQQAAAQLSLTDLASDGAGTGISSATGGFTAQMVGNGFRIETTGGFTEGWYEITAFTDTNNVTIDRSAGVSLSGGAGKVGGAVATPTDALLEQLEAGNILWVKAGTYTFTANILLSQAGSAINNIIYEGYNATRGDEPTGTDRPLFSCGAYYLQTGLWYQVKSIRFTGTANYNLYMKNQSKAYNCKFENTSGSGGRLGFYTDGGTITHCEYCEFESTNGTGGQGTKLYCVFCDAHDSDNGLTTVAFGIIACNIYDCTTGISSYGSGGICMNNTIDNCTTGVNITGSTSVSIINNIFSNNTTGLSSATDYDTVTLDFNNFHNNGTDVSNVTKGANTTSDNPNYTGSPDFEHNLSANAMPPTQFQTTTPSNWKQGTFQSDSGGGAETAYGFVG